MIHAVVGFVNQRPELDEARRGEVTLKVDYTHKAIAVHDWLLVPCGRQDYWQVVYCP